MATCQPFQGAKQQDQHLHLQHGGCAPPSEYGRAVPPPPAAQVPPSSSVKSATEARALKVHSEAERRRRERINAHLATLRRTIPDARQMDKATLLARVVNQLKELKTKAAETAQPVRIPAEANGINVDCYTGADATGYGRPTTYVRASVSCDDRPGLFADLAGAFRGLRLRPLRADMASLRGRARCEFILCKEDDDVVLSASRMKVLEEAVKQVVAKVAFPDMVTGCNSRSRRQRLLESHYVLGHELDVLGDNRW